MPVDYRPDPHHTVADTQPKPSQITGYRDEEGDTYTFCLTFVGDQLPNGNWKVAGVKFLPSNSTKANTSGVLGNPVAIALDDCQFNPTRNLAFYCPCNPPLPGVNCP